MTLYLYAVVDGLEGVGDLVGICGEALTVFRAGQLLVIGSELDALPTVSAETLGAQDATVRALHARAAALLPMRFGTSFSSRDDAERAIAVRAVHLAEQLRLVRGRDQMTLTALRSSRARVAERGDAGDALAPAGRRAAGGASLAPNAADDQAAPGAAPSGTAYLHARAAAAVPPAVGPLLDAVQALVHARRVEPGRAPGVVARVYHLISRGGEMRYRDAVSAASARVPDLTVRVAGPSPCYAFT